MIPSIPNQKKGIKIMLRVPLTGRIALAVCLLLVNHWFFSFNWSDQSPYSLITARCSLRDFLILREKMFPLYAIILVLILSCRNNGGVLQSDVGAIISNISFVFLLWLISVFFTQIFHKNSNLILEYLADL